MNQSFRSLLSRILSLQDSEYTALLETMILLKRDPIVSVVPTRIKKGTYVRRATVVHRNGKVFKRGKATVNPFGSRLRDALSSKNLTQVECGRRVGVHGSTVNNWLKGHYLPSPSLYPKIEKVLGITLTER